MALASSEVLSIVDCVKQTMTATVSRGRTLVYAIPDSRGWRDVYLQEQFNNWFLLDFLLCCSSGTQGLCATRLHNRNAVCPGNQQPLSPRAGSRANSKFVHPFDWRPTTRKSFGAFCFSPTV